MTDILTPLDRSADDWFDRLYSDEQEPETVPQSPASSPRIVPWWTAKPELTVSAEPEADEPEPERPAVPAAEAQAAVPEPEPAPIGEQPWLQPRPGYYPARPRITPERACDALSPKTRGLLYNAAAAGAGWGLGLGPQLNRWITDCGARGGTVAALVLGCGICLVVAHVWDRRTRHWWIGLGWAARIPLASALTALALYAPGAAV